MPKSCAVYNCNSSGRMPLRKFYRFPMLNHRSEKALAITQTRQNLWVRALNRADFFPRQFRNATVCDLHFVSGRSAKFNDVDNVDWVPTLKLGYTIKIVPREPTPPAQSNEHQLEFNETNIKRELNVNDNYEQFELNEVNIKLELNADDNAEQFEFNEANIKLELNADDDDAPTEEKEKQMSVSTFSVHTQTDDRFTGMSSEIILRYEQKIASLEEMLYSNNVTVVKFR